MLWIESPSNPLTKICDIAAVAALARRLERQHGGQVTVVVDATWMTPCICQPLTLGADIVMHSLTKFIGGHSDLLGGAVVLRDCPHLRTLAKRLRQVQMLVGSGLAPLECWLALRGLRSLAARMHLHCTNAGAIAKFLETHPQVVRCHYPGLASHPQHNIARHQMKAFGGMLSFEVASASAARNILSRVKVFCRATSLGGTESLIEHRRDVEGPYSSTPEGLIRLSIGLEDSNDLITDLAQALDCTTKAKL